MMLAQCGARSVRLSIPVRGRRVQSLSSCGDEARGPQRQARLHQGDETGYRHWQDLGQVGNDGEAQSLFFGDGKK